MENVHGGHRERLKRRFAEHGLEPFSDIEAIEMLLFYALPRRDTNELAHALLDRFGSYRAVLEADISELTQVPGVGENAAMLIRLVSEMNRRYMVSKKHSSRVLISDGISAGEYLLPLFAYQTEEVVYAISLGSGGNVIRSHKMARGMSSQVDFAVRDLVEIALKDKAVFILLAHNHLSDTALPSKADIISTKGVQEALSYVGVKLFDHIIVCEDDFVSLRDSGYFYDT